MFRGGWRRALEAARAKVVVKSPLAVSLGICHRSGFNLRLGQGAVSHGGLIGGHCQSSGLVFRVLDHVDHVVTTFFRCSQVADVSAGPGILKQLRPVTVCSTAME